MGATSNIELTGEQMQIVFAFSHNFKTVKFLENALQSIAETQGCFLYLKIPGQEKIRVLPGTEIELIQVAACENNKTKKLRSDTMVDEKTIQEINGFKIVEIDGDDGNLIAYHVIGEGVFERFTDHKTAMDFIVERSEKMLSEKMVEYRAKHNLTQKKLAELCGITVQTVIKAEQGKPLTRLTAKKIELAIKEG